MDISWKTADDLVSPNTGLSVMPKKSIANQIFTHFLFSAFIILVICMAGLYFGISQSLKNHTTSFMRDEIGYLLPLLESDDLEDFSTRIVTSSQKEYAKLYVRLLDEGGMPVIETPSMGQIIPAIIFPQPVPYQQNAQNLDSAVVMGNVYLICSYLVPTKYGPRHIQAALDISNLEHVLKEYLIRIIAVLLTGVLLSGLAGRYITTRGLKPLESITSKTRQITASRLEERFASEKWPFELVSLAEAMDEMMDRLQDSFERLKSYAANLAHEIRTPIGILRGEAEIALTRRRNCEEYERVIESSLEEYHRLTKIIESLLFLAMADSREVVLNCEEIRVYDEILNLQDYYSEYSEGKGFMVLCDPDLAVWADSTLFRRSVSNLISNAVKYSPTGELVTIEAIKTAQSVVISVSDNGRGIAPEHIERLFDRFYRIPDDTAHKVKGTGLGLSIVRSIMLLHGGSVTVNSAPGKGTCVTLTFPVKNQTI